MVYLHKTFGNLAQQNGASMGGVAANVREPLVDVHKEGDVNLFKMPCVRHLAQKGRQKRLKKTTFLYKKTLANCKMIMYNIAMDEEEDDSNRIPCCILFFEEEMK